MEVVFPDAGEWTLEFGLQQLLVIPTESPTVTVVELTNGLAAGTATIDAAAPDCGLTS